MKLIETDLVDWKERYQSLLDSMNVGFMLFDVDYNCYDVNQTLLDIVGDKREKYVGHNASEWYSKEEFEELYNLVEPTEMDLKETISPREKKYYSFEWYLYHANGEKIPIWFNNAINTNAKGEHESTYVTCFDLREQKRILAELEREKKKLEAILFGIGDYVNIYDLEGKTILSDPKSKEIKGKRSKPTLPLTADSEAEVSFVIGKKQRNFHCHLEPVQDHQGSTYAYVEILKDITSQVQLKQQEEELLQMKRKIKKLELKSKIIIASQPMRQVLDLITRCAEVDSTVLILGETGVGKELVAKAVHEQSSRKKKPFVAVNCGAIPETLLESELFGHVEGAFTGATSERRGLFRAAEGGILFLDEVGDLSTILQIKLLRVLQEKEVRPVGSSKTYPVNVRVIGATHRNLEKMVKLETFRRDLYYRLAVIPINIPPLRKRKEDILPLAEHFIKKHSQGRKPSLKKLDHSSQQLLRDYPWPGNIRELENCIEHAIAMAGSNQIMPSDLPVQITIPQELSNGTKSTELLDPHHSSPIHDTATSITPRSESLIGSGLKPWELEEKREIENALIYNKGNRSNTAKDLGICRTSLWRKIKLYNVNI